MEFLIAPLLVIVVLLLLFVLLIFALFLFDSFLELPYVATEEKKVETILRLAKIKPGETIVDLGSGDGRLLIAAAQKGAHAIGYEINPLLILFTILLSHIKGLSNQITIKKENLWKADLAIADVVFVYGRRKNMQRFEEFVYKNAKAGTRIVVNTNQLPHKKPKRSENYVYLYNI